MRLVRFFTLIALIPTILVAVFATITLNFGLEGWFSDRVRNVVANSLAAAQAYEDEHRVTLQHDAGQLGGFLDEQKARNPLLVGGQLRDLLTRGQLQMQRALPKAYVIDGDGQLRARGERSYLFWYAPPTAGDIERARSGETVIIQDWENNQFWALLQLKAFPDHFLYVSRDVDGKILEPARRHPGDGAALPAARGRSRPAALRVRARLHRLRARRHPRGDVDGPLVRRAAGAAGRPARLARPSASATAISTCASARSKGDDEIALLGRTFNEMTRQVKGQRDALIAANAETERRRRLFDSVLSGVTAGVIGVDGAGRIEMMNAAAAALARPRPRDRDAGPRSPRRCPSSPSSSHRLDERKSGVAQAEVQLRRRSRERDLLVRVAGAASPTTAISRATSSPSTT